MDVVTLGETMAIFTPESVGMMRYERRFTKSFGGAETNVAIGLSRLGHQVGWISRVGMDEFSNGLLAFLRGEAVDISQVRIDSEMSTGLQFREFIRPNEVHVHNYRKHSAASQLQKEDINERYLQQAKYLFITGITPALSDSCCETVFHSIAVAKKHGVQVVFDPNVRKKLWKEEKARKTLLAIAAQSDIILPGLSEGEFMLQETELDVIGARFLELGARLVVVKLGEHGSVAFTSEGKVTAPPFPVKQVVDPVGAGDAFAAGFLSGQLDGLTLEESLLRGNASGALVMMTKGDFEGNPLKEDLIQFLDAKTVDVSR